MELSTYTTIQSVIEDLPYKTRTSTEKHSLNKKTYENVYKLQLNIQKRGHSEKSK